MNEVKAVKVAVPTTPQGMLAAKIIFRQRTRLDILQGQALFRGVEQKRKKEKKKKKKEKKRKKKKIKENKRK